ncbi:von Willebrand factor type A domain protein, partial [Cooperia oncophora]
LQFRITSLSESYLVIFQWHDDGTQEKTPDEIGKEVNRTLELLTPPPESDESTSEGPDTMKKTTAVGGTSESRADKGSPRTTTGQGVTFPEEVTHRPRKGQSQLCSLWTLHRLQRKKDGRTNTLIEYVSAGTDLATYQAYELAKNLLLKEESKHKSVIIISNGQSTTCRKPGVEAGDEKKIAEKWHDDGTQVIYLGIGEPVNKTNMETIANGTDNVIGIPDITEVSLLFVLKQLHKPITDIQEKTPDEIGKEVNRTLELLTPPPESDESTSEGPDTMKKTTAVGGTSESRADKGSPRTTTGQGVTFPEEVTPPPIGEPLEKGKSTTKDVSEGGTDEGSQGGTTGKRVTFPGESTESGTTKPSEKGATEDDSRKRSTTKEGPEIGKTPFPLPPDTTSEGTKSVVFIVDASSPAAKEGWKNIVELVVGTAKGLKNAREAVVVIACPAEIVVPMGTHSSLKLRNTLIEYVSAGTDLATYQAYELAKNLLLKEESKHKSVIIISNGQSTTCRKPGVEAGDEKKIAEKWHDDGTQVIYLGIGEPVNKTNMETIANGTDNVIGIPDITEEKTPDEIGKEVNRTLELLTPPPESDESTSEGPDTMKKTTAVGGTSESRADKGSPRTTTGQGVTFPEEVTPPPIGEPLEKGKSTTKDVSEGGTDEGSQGGTTGKRVTFPGESTESGTTKPSEKGATEDDSRKRSTTKEGPEIGKTPFPLPPDTTSNKTKSVVFIVDASSPALVAAWEQVSRSE